MKQTNGFRLIVHKDKDNLLPAFDQGIPKGTGSGITWQELADQPDEMSLKGWGTSKGESEYDYLKTSVRKLCQRGIRKAIVLSGFCLSEAPSVLSRKREWIIEPENDGECLDWFSIASVYASVVSDFRLLWLPECHAFLTTNAWHRDEFQEYFFLKEGKEIPKANFSDKEDGICLSERDRPDFGTDDFPFSSDMSPSDRNPRELGAPFSEILRIYGLPRIRDLPNYLWSVGSHGKLKVDSLYGIEGKPILDYVCRGRAKRLYSLVLVTDKERKHLGNFFYRNSNGSLASPELLFDWFASHEAFMYRGGILKNDPSIVANLFKLGLNQIWLHEATQDALVIFFSFDTAKGAMVDRQGNASFFDLGKAPHPRTQG